MTDFAEWLEIQLSERNWRPAELARRTGLDTGYISNLLNRERNLGPRAGRAIAHALDLPEELVFREAGLLSPKNEEPPEVEEWVYYYLKASKEERLRMLEVAKILSQRSREGNT